MMFSVVLEEEELKNREEGTKKQSTNKEIGAQHFSIVLSMQLQLRTASHVKIDALAFIICFIPSIFTTSTVQYSTVQLIQ